MIFYAFFSGFNSTSDALTVGGYYKIPVENYSHK